MRHRFILHDSIQVCGDGRIFLEKESPLYLPGRSGAFINGGVYRMTKL